LLDKNFSVNSYVNILFLVFYFIFTSFRMICFCNFSSGFIPPLIEPGALSDAVPCRRPENGFDFTQYGIIHDASLSLPLLLSGILPAKTTDRWQNLIHKAIGSRNAMSAIMLYKKGLSILLIIIRQNYINSLRFPSAWDDFFTKKYWLY
jgi:hypothetical protein